MKVAVCDDEAIFVDRICALLERWAQKRNLCLSLYRFSDGDALLETHLSEVMDLIFLDVRMPFIDGMDAARELRAAGSSVPIIFISSAREYAVDSYKVDAFWYLVKPVDETLLYTVLDKFHRTFHEKKEMVVLRTQTGYCKISTMDVDYLEAQSRHVIAYLSNGSSILLTEKFFSCEQHFSLKKGFCKCHRSYIVNLRQIKEFDKIRVVLNAGTMIPISRNSYQIFKENYFSYMFQ